MAELFDSLPAESVVHTFCVFNCIFSAERKQLVSHVLSDQCMRLIVPDKTLIFRNPFSTVLFRDNFRPEVASDIISCVVVDRTGADVYLKLAGFRSNCSCHIRAAHFVTNERRQTRVMTRQERHVAFWRKIDLGHKNDKIIF